MIGKTNVVTPDAGEDSELDWGRFPVHPLPRQLAVESDGRLAPELMGSNLGARLAELESRLAGVLDLLGSQMSARLPWPGGIAEEKPVVAVHCLGTFQLVVGGVRVENWRSGKARVLFQYLVNHRDRPVPRHTLIEALWPDPNALASGTSLKVAVHALRQVLGHVGDGAASFEVLAHGSSYQLNTRDLWLDVEEFERCYKFGRRLEAQGRAAEAHELYTRAADFYQGDFLEELADDWAVFRREALKDQYLSILAALAKAALEAGDFQGSIVRCQQLLQKDRCREDTYRMLMLCHGRLGQRSRVRSWYEFCVRTLRTELDVTPEPETERVYRLAITGKL